MLAFDHSQLNSQLKKKAFIDFHSNNWLLCHERNTEKFHNFLTLCSCLCSSLPLYFQGLILFQAASSNKRKLNGFWLVFSIMGNIKWIAFLHLSIVFPRILNIKCMCWLFVSWMGEAERKYIGLHWDKTEWITLMVFHKRCKWRMPLYCDSWRKADKKLIPRSSLILDPQSSHPGSSFNNSSSAWSAEPSMDSGECDGLEDHILQRILNVDCWLWQSWSWWS